MKRQRQDTIVLPVDAWTVIASFAAVEDILAVLSLTRAIRSAILNNLLDPDHFEPIDDVLVEKAFPAERNDNIYFQIYMELFRLFAVHMRGDIKYPVANIRDLLAWTLESQVKHNLVTFVRLVLLDKRMKDKEYQNVVLDVAAQCNQAEIVKLMLKSSCIERKTLEKALRIAIENAYTETLRVLIDDKRTPFMQKHNLREILADDTILGIVLDHRRFFENSRLLETLLQECSPAYPVDLVRFILRRCSENGFSNQTLWYIVNRISNNEEIVTELVQVPNFIVTKKMFNDTLTNELATAALVGGVVEPTIDWNDIWRQAAEKKYYNVLYALTEKRRSSICSLALQEVLPLLIEDLILFSTVLGDDRVEHIYYEVEHVCAGDNHVVVITKNQTLFSWGDNSMFDSTTNSIGLSQVGMGTGGMSTPKRAIPYEIETIAVPRHRFLKVSCGANHTVALAVDSDGPIMWGDNSQG
jgi:hypothetical protein